MRTISRPARGVNSAAPSGAKPEPKRRKSKTIRNWGLIEGWWRMSKQRQLTDQLSRDRIVSELHRNLLVEAGAGSGKTHEMSRRMAAGIASGAYQVEHLEAVTFTRKAAAELRGRFQLALEEELEQSARLDPRPKELPTTIG